MWSDARGEICHGRGYARWAKHVSGKHGTSKRDKHSTQRDYMNSSSCKRAQCTMRVPTPLYQTMAGKPTMVEATYHTANI
jgi:hypothetical protein